MIGLRQHLKAEMIGQMKNFGAIILALALLGPNAANASGKDEDGAHGITASA